MWYCFWELGILQTRRSLPRFLTEPHDSRKIRAHSNLAPEEFQDPGNICLDQSFYILQLWKYIVGINAAECLAVPYKAYGERGEKSCQGAINFRGNILEALMGWCQSRTLLPELQSYLAGRL